MEDILIAKKIRETNIKNSMCVDDMVWEVIVRLPTKSLMRFKSVSKLWYSIICNPNFAKEHSLHGGAFHGLLVGENLFFEDPISGPISFFHVSLSNYHNDTYNTCLDYKFKTDHTNFIGTEVVKGLIGLFDIFENTFSLCNIATRELLNIPHPNNYRAPPLNDPDSDYYPETTVLPYTYHLGFNHVQDVYKVLRLNLEYDAEQKEFITNTEIMTLGGGRGGDGGRWRVVGLAPTVFETRSLWINESLYWLAPKSINNICLSKKPRELIAFHLNAETFQVVPIPDQVREKFHDTDLAQIDGSPAILMFCQGNPVCLMVELWTINDDFREKELAGGACAWTKRIIDLPGTKWDNRFIYAGMLPTGKMLLAETADDKDPTPIYCYDHIENKASLVRTIYGVCQIVSQYHFMAWPRVEIWYHVMDWRSVQAWYHQENIIPLRSLVPNSKQ